MIIKNFEVFADFIKDNAKRAEYYQLDLNDTKSRINGMTIRQFWEDDFQKFYEKYDSDGASYELAYYECKLGYTITLDATLKVLYKDKEYLRSEFSEYVKTLSEDEADEAWDECIDIVEF